MQLKKLSGTKNCLFLHKKKVTYLKHLKSNHEI